MKRHNKIVAIIAVMALLMMTLVGCGGGSDSGGGDAESYKIGVLQQLEHPALDAATQGFVDTLEDLLGDAVEIDIQNAQNEPANCSTIASTFVAGQYDLILANATSALQAASAATADIPIVGTSITDYATALDISDWSGATGINVTGTSDLAPLEEQANMIKEVCPDVQKVGLLYCSAEANSIYQVKEMEGYLDAMGIAWEEYSAADSNEIQAVTTNAVASCDVIYIPTDNTMAGSTETIKNIVVNAGVPVIAGEQGICAGCGVATLSISYYDIGVAAGQMAYDILVNGADVATMDIQTAANVTKLFNAEICTELGITPPEGYSAIE